MARPSTTAAIPADGIWAPARRALTAGLVLAVTFVAFEALAVATILPLVGRHLGDLRLYGWVFSAFLLASLVGIVVAGTLADRVPLGQPMLAGLALFALGLVIGGTAPDMAVLVAGRAVQGLGAGVVPAVAYVTISRCYPDAVRPRMFAVLSTAWVVPGLAGPAIAALVAAAVGWRWVFLGLIPLVTAAGALVVLALRNVPPPASPGTATVPYLAVLGVVAGAGTALASLNSGVLPVVVGGRHRRRGPARCRAAPADTAEEPVRTARTDRHDPQPVAADLLLLRGGRVCPVRDRDRPPRPDGGGRARAHRVDPHLDGGIVDAGQVHRQVRPAPPGPVRRVRGRRWPRRDVRRAPAVRASRAGDRGMGAGRRRDRYRLRARCP